jgi:glc operon protein GlcG
MIEKQCLTSLDAARMMNACKEAAVSNGWPVSIAIVDEGGYLLHAERLDGAPLPSVEIAMLKARTAALSRQATKTLEDRIKERPATAAFPGRLPIQGGVPILYEGECLGGIGVSGVQSHEDEQVASAGLAALA